MQQMSRSFVETVLRDYGERFYAVNQCEAIVRFLDDAIKAHPKPPVDHYGDHRDDVFLD